MCQLSIITINFNNKVGLQRTIESVFNQTWQEFEYIVIDGGSTDGSMELIVQNQSKIDYWVSEADKGIYNAMNKGVEKATGDYILFLNSGDILHTSLSLETVIKNSESWLGVDIIYGNLYVHGANQFKKEYPSHLSFEYFLTDTLPHPSTFIKKECFEILVFDENLRIVSDWKFFIMGLCRYNFSFLKIDETISTFYLGGVSSSNPNLAYEERQNVLSTEFPMFLVDYTHMSEVKRKYYLAENSYLHIFKSLMNRIFRR